MQFNKIKKTLVLLLLFFLTIITRFCFLNWGKGYFFNPDENNMALAVFQMRSDNLNPNFFAYGQFPLFLSFFTTPTHTFTNIVLTLRFWSAVFSSLSILFFYLIAKNIFKSQKFALIFSLILIFTPGLIQSAHFGTTESLLFFVFSANIFLALKYFQTQNKSYFLLSVLISAIGLGSKITAVFFIMPVYISFVLIFKKDKDFLKLISTILFFTLFVSLLSVVFSPFNVTKISDFKSSMNYETSVAIGTNKVFYTRQFENSLPYVFQFQKVFPYANGIFVFVLSFLGFFFFLKDKKEKEIILFFIPSLIYLIYVGQLFVKWSRFMSPLFFIGPFFCLFIFKKIKNIFITFFLILILITPGIYFFQKYFYLDNRITASNWIKSNIPSDSFILSQSGDVVNLPLSSNNINVENFDFYQLDYNQLQLINLAKNLQLSDYILIPSRRVFKNQNNDNYPSSKKYFQNLFSNKLGFNQIKIFSLNKSLFLNDENAEETWSVFDNPTIRIYQKDNNNLTQNDYQKILTNN